MKQHLAALRVLSDWLVTGHVLDVNPAHAVRGPKYVAKKGKTPVLTADEVRELLDSIKIARSRGRKPGEPAEKPDLAGLRDRVLIAVMVYSFTRINAVIEMKADDYFVQGRSGWVRLHEKAARSTESAATTIRNAISMNASPPPALPATRTARYSARRPASLARSPAMPCGSRTPTA